MRLVERSQLHIPMPLYSAASVARSFASCSAACSATRMVMSWVAPTMRTGLPSSHSTEPVTRTQIARPSALVMGRSTAKLPRSAIAFSIETLMILWASGAKSWLMPSSSVGRRSDGKPTRRRASSDHVSAVVIKSISQPPTCAIRPVRSSTSRVWR